MADKTMCTNFKYTPQVCLKIEQTEDMFRLFLINNTFDDIVITIPPDISKLTLQNLQSSVTLPLNKKIGPQVNNEHLFDLKVVNKAAESSCNANPLFKINIGDPDAKSDGKLYALPFEKGKKFLCLQSFNGKFTHKDNFKYAVDFQMNVGTKVTAARSGIVAEVKQDSNKGGNDKKLINEGNFVRIRHDDGTFGFYGHLKQNGAKVNVGQKVNEGDIIAESGNTGFTTGPHLHFDIRIADGKGSYNMTIDWKFKSVNGRQADIPKENEMVENK